MKYNFKPINAQLSKYCFKRTNLQNWRLDHLFWNTPIAFERSRLEVILRWISILLVISNLGILNRKFNVLDQITTNGCNEIFQSMRIVLLLICTCSMMACSTPKNTEPEFSSSGEPKVDQMLTDERALDQVMFLVGTWKKEHKDQFEVWTLGTAQTLLGKGYKVHEDSVQIFEFLEIKVVDDTLCYMARVPSQNDNAEISFKLNDEIDSLLSFENLEHDFPKKIRYKLIQRDTLMIQVLGVKDDGFSFLMFRVE